MKKFLFLTSFALLLNSAIRLSAQEVSPPPPPPPPPGEAPAPPPPPDKMQSEEITIKRKGDKDVNLNIRITGDNVLINGKPLMEFNEDGVSISSKKVIVKDGNKITIFDNQDDPVSLNFDNFFNPKNSNEKVTFLGVSTAADKDGALIEDVTDDSPAQKAGLQKGDIITKVGSEAIATPDDLSKAIRAMNANDVVKISYLRNGKKKSTKATLAERKSSAQVFGFSAPNGNYRKLIIPPSGFNQGFSFNNNPNWDFGRNGNIDFMADSVFLKKGYFFNNNHKKLGLKIQDTEDENGVKVLDVEDSSAAMTAGIKPGDIITQIGDNKVSNTDDARYQLAENREKSVYNIKAMRNGQEMNFEIKFPKKLKTANL